MNALLSSEGREGGLVNDRQVERQSYCDASLFNKERSRQGQTLTSSHSPPSCGHLGSDRHPAVLEHPQHRVE